MNTTLELSAELVREVERRAEREGRKLREVTEEIIRRGLAVSETPHESTPRHRVKLPLIPAPAGARPFELTGERLMELERAGASA